MTNVDILFRYSGQPSERELFALSNAREVYGIRRLVFDREASTLTVEYDATRLRPAEVESKLRMHGLPVVPA